MVGGEGFPGPRPRYEENKPFNVPWHELLKKDLGAGDLRLVCGNGQNVAVVCALHLFLLAFCTHKPDLQVEKQELQEYWMGLSDTQPDTGELSESPASEPPHSECDLQGQ